MEFFKSCGSLGVFLIFFVPGFISLKIYDLQIPGEKRNFNNIFEAAGFSGINLALVGWIPLLAIHHFDVQSFVVIILLWVLVLFICPILWPILFVKLVRSKILSRYFINSISSPWDRYFGNLEPCWMIIHLNNGKIIGGRFGSNSIASSSPKEEQLYIEEVWRLEDGTFKEKIEGSKGIFVFKKDFFAVEMFHGGKE
jgi:hypothetical protein